MSFTPLPLVQQKIHIIFRVTCLLASCPWLSLLPYFFGQPKRLQQVSEWVWIECLSVGWFVWLYLARVERSMLPCNNNNNKEQQHIALYFINQIPIYFMLLLMPLLLCQLMLLLLLGQLQAASKKITTSLNGILAICCEECLYCCYFHYYSCRCCRCCCSCWG